MEYKEHHKETFDELCPNCDSDDIEAVIGWCYNHGSPDLEQNGLFFCEHPPIEAFVSQVKGAFFCHGCSYLYDKNKMIDWDKYDFTLCPCPVGEEYEETPKEYADNLIHFILEYKEDRIDKCLREEYYIEAIVYLHRHIFDQLRYLLLKKIKGQNNIPLDESDSKYKEVVPFLKNMADETLSRMAFIYGRINKEELGNLKALNTLRNQFVHAWKTEERKKRSKTDIENILNKAKIIERRLKTECEKLGIIDALD